jgi:hypothetical protein
LARLPTSEKPIGHQPISFARVVELMAPALGTEKSEELVTASAKNLGYAAESLDVARALRILESLESQAGLVGVAARFAKSRVVSRTNDSSARVPRQAVEALGDAKPEPERPAVAGKRLERLDPSELVKLLAATLGIDKGRETLATALAQLGFSDRGGLDRAQALAVLDHIAREPGIVGVVARFSKARVILRFDRGG